MKRNVFLVATVALLAYIYPATATVLVQDDFSGSAGTSPDAARYVWSGEIGCNGSGQMNVNTYQSPKNSWMYSRTNAAPGAGETLVLKMRLSAYAEPGVYGNLQPRGLRVGNDANNAVEFYSIYGTTIGLRARKAGVETLISYPFPAGVYSLHDYEISVTTTSAVFKVDGVVAGTITNNLPTGALNFHVASSSPIGNVPVTIDSMELSLSNNFSALPPAITDFGPPNLTVNANANITFSVTATGTEPLSYQWRKNGGELAGETNTTLTLNFVQSSQAGNYAVRVTNAWGSVTSSVALLAVIAPSASTNFIYETNNGAITITDYVGTNEVVTIPSVINGWPVREISQSAFNEYYQAQVLKCVVIPDSVTDIGANAFAFCSGLTNVTIGNGLANIGYHAFDGCPSLVAFSVDVSNPNFSSTNGVLFNRAQTILIQYPEGLKGDYIIPGTVTNIAFQAFANCAGLTNIAIPDSVSRIELEAFYSCAKLASVIIPDSVLGTLSGSFVYCPGLTNAVVGNGVESLLDTFSQCSALANVVIGTNVTDISGAFVNCSNLKNVYLPISVTSLGNMAFAGCSSLTNIVIPEGVHIIGDSAFSSCGNLTDIVIPEDTTSIGSYAFAHCDGLTNVVFGKHISSIGNDAFYHCSGLTKVTIPDNITTIGSSAFSQCHNLVAATIGNGVTNIGAGAFSYCYSLTNVLLGRNLAFIDYMGFFHCTNLVSAYFMGNVPGLNADAVFDGANNCTIYRLTTAADWPPVPNAWSGRPTALWIPPHVVPGESSLEIRTNGFSFAIAGSSNLVVVIEACTNLAHPVWMPLVTNTLTDGGILFSDPQWAKYPGRFYRLRAP